MSAPGEVAVVLHTHLPYVRRHGVWPVGEEWLHQAWGTSWLAVTDVLVRLAAEGRRELLTLSVSPTVAHQLADPDLARDLGTWLGGMMWLSEEQRTRYEQRDREAVRALGPFHWRRYARLLDLHERVEAAGGLLAVWADLAARGVVELLAGPATHPYLPLADRPELVDAQLQTGLDAHARWAGSRPTGLWAPECGYRPAGPVGDPTVEPVTVDGDGTPTLPRGERELPGLEDSYARHGISHVVVDAPTVVRAAGGPERDWTRRPDTVDEVVHDGVRIGDSDVVAFARDLSVAYHVWSPHEGYPGDPWYRDFHVDGGFGVHPSWRVTDKRLAGHDKAVYEPDRAALRAEEHAAHLHGELRTALDPRPGALVVAAYDTELFGHWWLEGPTWLEHLLRRVDDDPRLRPTTLASRLERRPPTRRLHLPESSWGYAKGHASWVSERTRPMWAELRRVEGRFLDVRATVGPTDGASRAALEQAARELAQTQASDWPFMVNRGGSPGYGEDRFRGHLARCDTLLDAIEGRADPQKQADLAADLRETVDAPRDVSAFLAP